MNAPTPAPAPVSSSARRLGASLLALGRIRLELLSIEVQEERERIVGLIFWSVLGALMAGFGLVFVALLATVLMWDTPQRALPLGIGAAVFVLLAIYGVAKVRHLGGEGSALFQTSLAELRADEEMLRPAPGPAPGPRAS